MLARAPSPTISVRERLPATYTWSKRFPGLHSLLVSPRESSGWDLRTRSLRTKPEVRRPRRCGPLRARSTSDGHHTRFVQKRQRTGTRHHAFPRLHRARVVSRHTSASPSRGMEGGDHRDDCRRPARARCGTCRGRLMWLVSLRDRRARSRGSTLWLGAVGLARLLARRRFRARRTRRGRGVAARRGA